METFLWILQAFLAFTFLYSDICKTLLPEEKLIQMGQTGVAGYPAAGIKIIGLLEIVGAAGLILPWWLGIWPVLTPVSALCFALLMVLAAPIHYKRKEPGSVGINLTLFVLSLLVVYFRSRIFL
jgi:hypothetical protein